LNYRPGWTVSFPRPPPGVATTPERRRVPGAPCVEPPRSPGCRTPVAGRYHETPGEGGIVIGGELRERARAAAAAAPWWHGVRAGSDVLSVLIHSQWRWRLCHPFRPVAAEGGVGEPPHLGPSCHPIRRRALILQRRRRYDMIECWCGRVGARQSVQWPSERGRILD